MGQVCLKVTPLKMDKTIDIQPLFSVLPVLEYCEVFSIKRRTIVLRRHP